MLFDRLSRWFRKVTQNRFGTTWQLRKNRLPLRLLGLEDRLAPATFTEAGTQLNLSLAANESIGIISGGTDYTIFLTVGSWSGTDSANVSGNATTILTVNAPGLAAFTDINISDAGVNTSVQFKNSGANSYSDNFNVTLDDLAAGAISFSGATNFTGTSSLTAATARNISFPSGSSLKSVDGNIDLSANQQAAPTAGNFAGISVNGATISSSNIGVVSLTGRGGTDSSGGQHGVYIFGSSTVQGGAGPGNSLVLSGTGGNATAGNNNVGVVIGDGTVNKVQTTGGNVKIDGFGGGKTAVIGGGVGVYLVFNSSINAAGNGSISVSGTGADNLLDGNGNFGFGGDGTSTISTNNGDIVITGVGGNTKAATQYSAGLYSGTDFTAGGIGNLTVNATGGTSKNMFGAWFRSGGKMSTSNGKIIVNASVPSGGTGIYMTDAGTSIISGNNQPVVIATDSFATTATPSTISSGTGSTTIRPFTNGTKINLGGADVLSGSPLTLGLTDAELDRVTAGTLTLGDGNSSEMSVTATITRSAATNVVLMTGGNLKISGGQVNTGGGTLKLDPGASPFAVNPTNSGTDATASTVSFGSDLAIAINGTTVDTQYTQLKVGGNVDLSGVDLILGGAYVPVSGDVFTIVSVSGGTISNTFTGLSDGDTITFNGSPVVIKYTTTAVTLSYPLPDVSVAVSPASVNEDSGSGLVYTFSRTGPTTSALTVNFTVGGLAVFGTDYTQSGAATFGVASGSVVIPIGFSSADVTLTPTLDTTVEVDETAILTVDPASGYAPASPTTATGTVNNDDTSVLSISSPTVAEGTAGSKTLTFTVTSSQAVQGGFTVAFTVANGSADGADYTVTTVSPLAFVGTAGESQTISVDVATDAIVEEHETLTATLGAVAGTTAQQAAAITTGATGTGTINNDDASVLSISSPIVTEGTGGVTTMTFTVTSSNAVDGGFDVAFTVANGSAGGGDYSVTTSSPLTFSGTAGETQTISIDIVTDSLVEDDETFTVTLGAVGSTSPTQAAAITSGAVGTGTITNDDTSTLSIDNATVTEGTGGTTTMTFTVTSSGAVQGGFTVAFSVANGSTSGADYSVTTSSPLAFAGTAGETQTISIDIATDSIVEDDETFTVTLGAVAGTSAVQAAAITSGAVGSGTITNDDASTLSISDATVTEGTGGVTTMTFTVTSSGAVQGGFDVAFAVANGSTSGADYTVTTSSPVSFAGTAGETQSIVIDIVTDSIVEAHETLTVTLGAISATTAVQAAAITSGAVGNGTINNDDTSTLSIGDATVTEGTGGVTTMTFTVTSSGAVQGGFDVAFSVANGSAGGADYSVTTLSPLTFSGTAGETQTISIDIVTDSIVEDHETLTVTLGAVGSTTPVQAAAITTGAVGTGTISNDDSSTLSIGNVTVTEGTGGTTTMTFTVTSSGAVQGGFDVAFTVANGSTSGADYTVTTSSPLSFSGTAGETQTISIDIATDAIVEDDESLTVTLGAVSNTTAVQAAAITTGAVGTGTISNDDSSTLSIGNVTVTEGTGGVTTMTFTVTSSGAVQGGFDVAFSVANGSAGAADYTVTTSSPLTFSGTAGETQTISIDVVTDSVVEDHETLTVTLGVVSATTPIQATAITTGAAATGTINNDDSSTLTIGNVTVTEGTGGVTTMTFTVTSSGAVQGGFTVAFSVADFSTNGADYTVSTASPLIFAGTAGETQTISIDVVTDSLVEANETLMVTLGTVGGTTAVQAAAITSGAVGTGTITNDDTAVISIASASANETAGMTTFTISISNQVDVAVSVRFDTLLTGSASSGTDYSAISSMLVTFPAFSTSDQFVTVTIADDLRVEGTESFDSEINTLINNGRAVSLTGGGASTGAIGTVNDNDFAVAVFSSATSMVTEATVATTRTVTLNLITTGSGTAGLDQTVIVRSSLNVGGTTATNGTDFTYVNPTDLTFSPGDGTSFAQTIGVSFFEDLVFEGSESVQFDLAIQSDGTGTQASVGSPGSHTITLIDNDSATNLVYDAAVGGKYTFKRNAGNIELYQGVTLVATAVYSASVGITFNGSSSGDTLTFDYSTGSPVPGLGSTFNGNDPTTGPGDAMAVQGGSFDVITGNFTGIDAGNFVLDPLGAGSNTTITYTGLEPVLINAGSVTDIVFNLPAAATTAALADDGIAVNATSRLSGDTFEQTDFTNPSNSLTVNGDAGAFADSITVNSLPDFTAKLNVDGGGGADTINFGQTLTTTADLVATAEAIQVKANVTTTGSQTFNGAVGVSGTRTLTANGAGNDIFFNGIVDAAAAGADELSAIANDAVVTASTVGSINRLGSFSVTSGGLTQFGGNVSTDASGGKTANISIAATGGVVLTTSTVFDSESGNAAAGSINFNSSAISGNAAGLNLTLDSSTGTGNAGAITLFTVDSAAGFALNNLIASATGPAAINDNDVTFNAGVTLASGGNLSANGRTISQPNTASDLIVSGSGTIGLTASRNVSLSSGSSLVSASGAINVAANQGGTPTAGNFIGVNINGATINSTVGGTITVQGRGGNDVAGNQLGVQVLGASVVGSSTSGAVNVTGKGGAATGAGASNFGISVTGTGSLITSGGGNVLLTGTGGGAGTGANNHGVVIFGAGQVSSTGAAILSVVGTGGSVSTGGSNLGVLIDGAGTLVTSATKVDVNGTGGGIGASGSNRGVGIQTSAMVTATGAGVINLTGIGGASTGTSNRGVFVLGAAVVSTASGDITINATGGGTGTSSANRAAYFNGVGAAVAAGGGGKLTITGNGGAGTGGNNEGVWATAGAVLSTVDGLLTVVGNGGAGGTAASIGVNLNNAVAPGPQVKSTGLGSISITGVGSINAASGNRGVSISGGTVVSTASGDITLKGTGGGNGISGANRGVYIFGAGTLVSASGAGKLDITGIGGGGTGTSTQGIRIGQGGQITTVNGDMLLSGTAGGSGATNFSAGVYMLSAGTKAMVTGTGNMSITGKGANITLAAGQLASGIMLGLNAGVLISTNSGDLTMVGTSISTDGSYNPGIYIRGGTATNVVTAGGAGKLTLTGTGAPSLGKYNIGVWNYGSLSSGSNDVTITGTGGGAGAASGNFGVVVGKNGAAIGSISTGGAGKITIIGNGGAGTGGNNGGVALFSGPVQTADGDITITGTEGTGPGSLGFSIVNAGTAVKTTGTGNINVSANSMDLGAGTSINAGANVVTLLQLNNGVGFDLGAAADVIGGPIGLSDGELDTITSGKLRIGNANTGDVVVSADVGPALSSTLRITTSGKITGTAGGIIVANLGINAGDVVNVTDTSSDVDSLAINTTNDNASFVDADGFVISAADGISALNVGTGNASLSAGGAVTQTQDVTAAGIELLGAGSFTLTSATNDVDFIAGSTANAVSFTDADGLTVGTVNSVGLTTGGDTTLKALGTLAFDQALKAAGFKAELSGLSIVDNTPAATDVEAASASFTASSGIGSADAIDTKVSTVAASTTTGDVQIDNQGGLTIGTVGTVIGVTGGGDAVISAASPLTVSANVVMAGNTTLTAGEISDFPVCADDLTVQSGVTVQSTGGDVTLQAGDDIILQAGSFVNAAGTVNLTAGFGDLDNCGTLILAGTITVGTDLNICAFEDLTVPTLIAPGVVSLRSMAGKLIDNNGAGVNVTASALAMQAATGIGVGDALETAVSTIEAETDTGGIFVDNNTASLTIGDIASPGCGMVLDGITATTSGDIKLTNKGSIFLTQAGQDIQTFGGDVTLIASTPTGDLTAGTGTAYGNVYASGKVSLQAGRDITLGYAGYYGDVQAGADVTISAGRHIVVQDFTYVFTNGAGSPMNFTAGAAGGSGDISIIKGSLSGATVFNNAATGGPINFTTAAGGVFTNTAPNGGVFSNGGDITVIADDMNITRPVNAAAGIVTLKQVTNGQAINFGGVGGLNLTDAELDQITASILRIGDANSGAMTVNQKITPLATATLHLTTGSTVTGSSFSVSVQNLAVSADGGVDLSASGNNVNKLAIATSNDTVTFVDISGFDIASVDGVNGVNVGTADASLKAGGPVTDSQPVVASGLALRGAGSFTLDAVGTDVNTLAADNSGDVTIDDSTGFDIGSVFGVNGVTNVPTLAVTAGGTVTDSQAIAVTNLLLRGAGPFTLDTASNNWTTMASDATGNVTVVDVNGFAVGTVSGVNGVNLGAGTFSVTSGGTLSQTQAVKANGLELFGAGPFNLNSVASNDVNTLAANVTGNVNLVDADDVTVGTVNTTSGLALGGADADIKAGGDLTLAEAISGGSTMFLTSSAKIVDAHVGTDVSGNNLGASAGTGIGATDAIDTAISTLAATSTSGAIDVANSGPLTIGTVGAIVGVTGGGSADISAASPLTIASNVIMAGNIVMTAGEISDFPTCADDLTVNGGVTVQSTAGDVTLQAGDDVILQAGSTVSAFGNITLTAGYNDLDTCGDLILNGTISGGGNIDLCALTDLTVGSVTSTGGTVTLRSVNGAIIDGNGATNNVTAPALAMGANKGIGTLLDHLETQVNAIEALDFLGGIFVDNNTASLKVGGVTPGCGLSLSGVEEFAGDVLLTNTGDLLIDQGEGVFANNDVTLKATGATADIRTGGNITAISALNDVNLQAGDDVELGDTAGFAYGDTFAGNNVNVTSGGDFVVGAFTYVTANAGSITANATGNIDVTSAGGYGSHLQAGDDVVLTAAGTFNHSPAGFGYISAGDDVQIMAKSMTTANFISAGDDVTLTSTTGDITDTTPSGYSGYNDTAVHGDLVTVSSAGKVNLDIDANNLTSTANGSSTFREINTVIVNSITAAGNLITLGNVNGLSTFTLLNGDALDDASTLQVDAGTLVDLNGDDETIGALQGFGDVNIGAQTLTTGGNNASTSFGGVMSGTGGNVIKLGSGIFTISGANTYDGTTSVLFGTLKMGASNVLDDDSSLIVNGATAVFAMSTFNDTVLAVSLIDGTISGPGTLTSQSNFDVQNGLVTANFAGNVGLVKTTAGVVTLAGANTYDGVSLINGGVLNLSGSLTGTGGDVILNANGVTLDGLGSGVITGRGVIVNTNKTATFVQNLAQVTAGPSLSGLVVGKGGSASILNNTITNNHIGIQVDGGMALIQGNNLSNNNKGTASTAAGLVASNGGIVDAGQNVNAYYTHFTLLAGGTGPGGASSGNNVFLGYPYLGANDWLANVPKAIRNNNTGGAYSKVGPQFGTNDLTSMNNTYDGTPSLFLIEKELYHDIDDFTRGFITYGNSTTPATMTDLRYYAVSPTQTYASGPPDYTLMTAGDPTGTYQASSIRRLRATFDGYVFIDQTKAGTSVPVGGPITGTGGIQIYKKNGPSLTFSNTSGFVNVNTLSAFYDQNTGNYSVNFGFSNPAGQYLVEPNGSLTDGNYDLGLVGNLIQGGGPGGAALTNAGTRSFYRFFGDFNGDRRVNNLDLSAMQASLARKPGDSAYRGYFNFDTIDLISGADYNAFVRRYRNQLNANGTTTPIVP